MSQAQSSPPRETPRELFQEIFCEARTLALPPSCCVPFVKIRKISESGVRRLMQSYRQEGNSNSMFTGASATGNLPMVVPLTGTEKHYPEKYFIEDLGLSEAEAEAEVSKFSTWYGIVEGCHRNESLRRLARESPESFASFTWTVLLLKPAPLQKLRAFARNISEKQKSSYNIASTVYDSLFSLREDYISLTALSSSNSVSITALCSFATGCTKPPSEAMRVLARRAIGLSTSTISKLGELLNAESPRLHTAVHQKIHRLIPLIVAFLERLL